MVMSADTPSASGPRQTNHLKKELLKKGLDYLSATSYAEQS
jgi:hypothetical protein